MKFTTEKKEIVEFLQIGAAIAERRKTIPILANLKLVAKDNLVEITATDLEIQVKIKTEVKTIHEEGETTVSARKMSELCRTLPEGEKLEFVLKEGKLVVSSQNFHADFSTLSPNDFPEIVMTDEIYSINLTSSLFKRLLNKTHFCMASQDVRYYLNGLLLEHKNSQLNAVATDGHRLALATKDLENKEKETMRLILPRKAALELSKILPEDESMLKISLGHSCIKIEDKRLDFTTKLVDGKFPDYEKVFPTGDSYKLTVLVENLRSALSRASVLSNEKYRGVRFAIKSNSLMLTANNPEQETAEEKLEVEYSGLEMEIGFNIGYMLDVLNSLEEDTVNLFFFNEESSCLIREPGNDSEVYVIMPMRL